MLLFSILILLFLFGVMFCFCLMMLIRLFWFGFWFYVAILWFVWLDYLVLVRQYVGCAGLVVVGLSICCVLVVGLVVVVVRFDVLYLGLICLECWWWLWMVVEFDWYCLWWFGFDWFILYNSVVCFDVKCVSFIICCLEYVDFVV